MESSGPRRAPGEGAAPLACMTRLAVLCALSFAVTAPVTAQCNQGAWSAAFNHEFNTANTNQVTPPPLAVWPTTFNAIHMALIPVGPYRGHVLVWDKAETQLRPHQRWSIVNPYWTPGSGQLRFRNFFLPMPQTASTGDLFCAGHAWGRDGRLFVAGGTAIYPIPPTYYVGASLVYQFAPDLVDPVTGDHGRWKREPDMAITRWYPWVMVSHDDSFLIAGGSDDSIVHNDYEVYRVPQPFQDPPANTTQDQRTSGSGVLRAYAGPGAPGSLHEYVRIHLLTTGQFFGSGPYRRGFKWDHVPASQPVYDFSSGAGPTQPTVNYGSHVIDPRAGGQDNHILRIGGSSYGLARYDVDHVYADVPSNWASYPIPYRLRRPRWMANAVILPSTEVFMVGGFKDGNNPGTPELVPELLRDQGWVEQPAHVGPRGYHATAVLLPDGRVFLGGADTRSVDYQIYSPPYLTCGRPRPQNVGCTIAPVVGGMKYRDDDPTALYTAWWDENLPAGVTVTKVVLVRPGSVTHHTDMDARYLELPIHAVDDLAPAECRISFRGPRNSRFAPRGWYMLFLVTNEKVPSEALWVHLQ